MVRTEHINYAWAKDFNRGGLDRHFKDHGKEFGCKSKEEYAAKALKFANTIDRENYKSVVDKNGTTYKYNPKTNVLVEVTKDGYIVSYRHYGTVCIYYSKKIKDFEKNRVYDYYLNYITSYILV